ncbi:tumor necrosis factor receptor superfamily member 17 [Lithobates pipiens]
MATRCDPNEYFDSLLLSCKPCHLRCPKIPQECKNPCPGVSRPVTLNDTPCIIWILLVMFVLLISIILFGTFILHRSRKRKFHRDSLEMANEFILKNAENILNSLEPTCNEVKTPVVENEDVGGRAVGNDYDTDLSDYLFPLPAVEEGAAILVTTKTSASFNPGPGVRGDTFLEMSQCMVLEQEIK